MMGIYYEAHIKHTNILYGKMQNYFSVTAGRTCCCYWAASS